MSTTQPRAREIDPLQGKVVAYFGLSDQIKRGSLHGYLMVLNGLGEPVEYNWGGVETPRLFAWDRDALSRAMVRKLLLGLLESMVSDPAVMLMRAEDVPTSIMGRELYVDNLPWARVSTGLLDGDVAFESPGPSGEVGVTLSNEMPPESREVVETLLARGSVMEPFERGRRALLDVSGGNDAGKERPE
jgi:hypothetical protein